MSNEQKVTRKLRAIFSADVKGYSVLMADDEVSTIQTLKDYRNIMSACIEQRGGRIVDAVGDNLLAEFDSAVDAVQCAVEVQKGLRDKNQELPEDKKMVFRIGVILWSCCGHVGVMLGPFWDQGGSTMVVHVGARAHELGTNFCLMDIPRGHALLLASLSRSRGK